MLKAVQEENPVIDIKHLQKDHEELKLMECPVPSGREGQ